MREESGEQVARVVALLAGLPEVGLGKQVRIQACTMVLVTLARILSDQNRNPYPLLSNTLNYCEALAEGARIIVPELDIQRFSREAELGEHDRAINMFENAWTSYSDDTYDHSVTLVRERLFASGYDETFFKGKTCFDGGCGTGRLALVMALAGAEKVVAADMGGASLEYFSRVLDRYGVHNVDIVEQDVTDLTRWNSGVFDFVASNGVLHHTRYPDRGIKEHFRITKTGGVFWLYLYGAGGFYWEVYDSFKPLLNAINPSDIRQSLFVMGVREGLIYTFLDNLLAPRVYYYLDDILSMLQGEGEFEWRHAKGRSEIDDTEKVLASQYGVQILGPQGEVRISVKKLS